MTATAYFTQGALRARNILLLMVQSIVIIIISKVEYEELESR